MKPLEGRIALVTGGSRGVGRAIVHRLAVDGAHVAFSYRRDAAAAVATEEAVKQLGGTSSSFVADLSVPGAAGKLVADVSGALGSPDILVNNAGTASSGRLVADTPHAEYLKLFQVHALAGMEAAAAVVPGMRERGAGAIVFVSSIVAYSRVPATAPYAMAKAAAEALAFVLALEEREHGIRVNVVAPGLVASDMGDRLVRASIGSEKASSLDSAYPFGRVCRPKDVADVVGFLAGPASSYVTRQKIVVDGGGAIEELVRRPAT